MASANCKLMWHEARQQEKFVQKCLVDYQKRAERRKEYYEKIKLEPTQFLQVHGRSVRILVDPAVYTAAEAPGTMLPWRGETECMIDRFDGRAHLDEIPLRPGQGSDEEGEGSSPAPIPEDWEERQANYERYRTLVQNEFLGIAEEKFLQQIRMEELYGPIGNKAIEEEKKALAPKKAAIGFSYTSEDIASSLLMPPSLASIPLPSAGVGTGGKAGKGAPAADPDKNDSDEESDSDIDLDMTVDVMQLTNQQQQMLNTAGTQYGLRPQDFMDLISRDLQEAEELRQVKQHLDEKAMLSGRKSRKERRALKKKTIDKKASPPSYAARSSPTYQPYRKQQSSSRSPSPSPPPPAATGKIKFITSFGGDSDGGEGTDKEDGVTGVIILPKPGRSSSSKGGNKRSGDRGERKKNRWDQTSADGGGRDAGSSSRDRDRYRGGERGRGGKDRDPRDRDRSRERSDRYGSRTDRRGSSPRGGADRHHNRLIGGRHYDRAPYAGGDVRRPIKSRSRSGSARRRVTGGSSSRSPGRRSASIRYGTTRSRSRSRDYDRPASKRRCQQSSGRSPSAGPTGAAQQPPFKGPGVDSALAIGDKATPAPAPPPARRYYGRRGGDTDSDDEDEEGNGGNTVGGEGAAGPSVAAAALSSGAGSGGDIGASSLKQAPSGATTRKEKLRKKMQALLKKQYKADKQKEREQLEKQAQERLDREEELREIALRMRRREREKRHQHHGSGSDSSRSSSRSASPSSPRLPGSRRSPSAASSSDDGVARGRGGRFKARRGTSRSPPALSKRLSGEGRDSVRNTRPGLLPSPDLHGSRLTDHPPPPYSPPYPICPTPPGVSSRDYRGDASRDFREDNSRGFRRENARDFRDNPRDYRGEYSRDYRDNTKDYRGDYGREDYREDFARDYRGDYPREYRGDDREFRGDDYRRDQPRPPYRGDDDPRAGPGSLPPPRGGGLPPSFPRRRDYHHQPPTRGPPPEGTPDYTPTTRPPPLLPEYEMDRALYGDRPRGSRDAGEDYGSRSDGYRGARNGRGGGSGTDGYHRDGGGYRRDVRENGAGFRGSGSAAAAAAAAAAAGGSGYRGSGGYRGRRDDDDEGYRDRKIARGRGTFRGRGEGQDGDKKSREANRQEPVDGKGERSEPKSKKEHKSEGSSSSLGKVKLVDY